MQLYCRGGGTCHVTFVCHYILSSERARWVGERAGIYNTHRIYAHAHFIYLCTSAYLGILTLVSDPVLAA